MSKDNETDCCGNCYYWLEKTRWMESETKEVIAGECHRFPPTTDGHQNVFPQTKSDVWCGEHKKKGKRK